MKTVTSFLSNNQRLYWIVVIIALVLYLINFNSFQVGTFGDDAAYIVLAQSLASGQGYARINFPTPEPEVAWPFGYPLLLTPLVAIFGAFNFSAFKLLSVALTILVLFILKKYLDQRGEGQYAWLIVALFAVNLHIVRGASMVMSEPAYLVFAFLALYVFDRFEHDRFSQWYQMPIMASLLVAASLTRLIGFALAAACIGLLLWRRNFRAMIVIGVLFVIGMLPQFALGRAAGGVLFPPEVAGQVGSNLGRVLLNIYEYLFIHIPQHAFGMFGPTTNELAARYGISWLVMIAKVILVSVVFLGFVRILRKRLQLGELYFVMYFAVISVKTFDGVNDTTPRYLDPLLPFIYLYLIQGIDWISSYIAKRSARPALAPLAVACIAVPILALYGWRAIDNAINPISSRITDLTIGTTWLDANAESDAIIMGREPIRAIYTPAVTP